VTASGGEGSLQYRIESADTTTTYGTESNFTGLPPGEYTVFVKGDSDYEETETVTLTAPDPIIASVGSFIQPDCPGQATGGFTVMASGGNGGFEYILNDGPAQSSADFTGLMAGKYLLTVQDSLGCQWQDSVQINSTGAPIQSDLQPETFSRCGPGEITLTVTSSFSSFNWYSGINSGTPVDGVNGNSLTITNLAQDTTLYVAVKDNSGCESTRTTMEANVLPIPDKPSVNIAQGEENISKELVLESSLSGAGYQWYLNGEAVAGATGKTFSIADAGNYTVEVINADGCSNMSDAVALTGLEPGVNQLQIHPNPVSNRLNIHFPSNAGQEWKLELSNLNGQRVLYLELENPATYQLDFSRYEAGIYLITLSNQEMIKRFKVQKIR
ncbi:MAG: T9SS type A sorting domain-containing protein, partial [Candidatus Cyclobacteriaceae bacterium M3_2C_046]